MPQILEKELEDYIFANHDKIQGLEGEFITRQLSLPGYGIIDLLIISNLNGYLQFKIVELKQGKIDLNAIGQICRYNTALRRNLEKIDFPSKSQVCESIELFLIGNEIDTNGDCCFLCDVLKEYNIKFITYNLDLEKGITFNQQVETWFNKDEKINYTIDKFIRKALTNSKICQNTNK